MIISSLIAQVGTQIDAQSILLFQQLCLLVLFARFVDKKF